MRIISAIVLAAWVGAAWADAPIYKWVDAEGHVHYSTEPHSDNAQQLNIQNSGTLPNSSTAPAPATAGAPSDATNDGALVIPTNGDSGACKQGRERLFQYLHADQLFQLGAKDQKQALSPQDKQRAIDGARNFVLQMCKPGGPS